MKTINDSFEIHTDGGARGNPGPAAIGVVVQKNEKTIYEIGKRIGESTNNVAEYAAVTEGLQYLKKIGGLGHFDQANFFIDSNLVVQQLNGYFKVKDAKLRNLFIQIKILEQEIGGVVTYQLIPREQNTRADFLVNQSLDNNLNS